MSPQHTYRKALMTTVLNTPVPKELKDMVYSYSQVKGSKMSFVVRSILRQAIPKLIAQLSVEELRQFKAVMEGQRISGQIESDIEKHKQVEAEQAQEKEREDVQETG